jgi:predicted branched-subunit amino acid permease
MRRFDGIGHGLRAGVPIAAADLVDGMAFGTLAVSAGLGAVAAVAMSATAFSGSAQFAAVATLAHGGGLVGGLVAAAALNARYLVLGTAVAPALARRPLIRLAQAHVLTDAGWALAQRGRSAPDAGVLVGVGLAELCGWTAGTAVGAVAGGVLGGGASLGLDSVYPVFFLALLCARADRRGAFLAVAGGLVALALTPVVAPGLPVLAAGVLAFAAGGRRG